jgi:polyribonucleotide nucleotidyltransferase
VNIASADSDAVKKALAIIKGLTTEPEIGAVYKGTVTRVADFGAFIEILPGTDGLLHVSEMAHHRVDKVTDVMKEGDPVEVKVISVDRDGKIRLTRRELLPLPEGEEGERAKQRIQQAREVGGPPPRSGGGRDRDRRDGPPRDRGPRR